MRSVRILRPVLIGSAFVAAVSVAPAQEVDIADIFGRPDAHQMEFAFDPNPGQFHASIQACFAPGTPQEYVNEINAFVDGINQIVDPGLRYQLGSRWTGGQGSPIMLTWSLAPDGLNIPNGIGEGAGPNTLFATLDARFAGNRTMWISRIQQVFDRWPHFSGLTYTRITVGGNEWDDGAAWDQSGAAGLRGDVRICAKVMDGAGGVLAYNQFPGGGSGGNMHLDSGESWGSASNNHRFFRNTVAHEHGHGIGLAHVCPIVNGKLMEPFLSTSFEGPRHDEVRAAQRHYGDPYEPDNTTATARDLGTVAFDTPVTPCGFLAGQLVITNTSLCSIDANGENDFYKFTISGPGRATVTVTPQGTTYQSGQQTQECNTGTSINSANMANLTVAIRGTDGTTVLGTSDVAPVGSVETLSNVNLPAAGLYYIHVAESDAPGQSQLYTLSLTVEPAGCPGDVNGDSAVDLADLATLLTNFGTASGATQGMGDLDGDQDVDLADLAVLLANFGQSC